MHGGIRKAPEWVCVIRQKVGGVQGVFARSNGLTAEGTISPASFDPIHDCKLTPVPPKLAAYSSPSRSRVHAQPSKVPTRKG